MKRPILFRGKRADGKGWAKGYYVGANFIYNPHTKGAMWYEVIDKTIGEFTGLTDMNGLKIFEGDIVHLHDDDLDMDITVECFYWKEFCKFSFKNTFMDLNFLTCDELEIIGNIHDNPELLKQ